MRQGVVWKFIGQGGLQATRFVIVAVLARLLSPDDYGAAAVAVALASFASTLGDLGMGSALVQTPNATQRVRSTAFWGAVGFGAATSTVFVLLAEPVGRFLDDPRVGPIVAVGALTFFIYSLGSTSQALFMRAMSFKTLELRYLASLWVAGIVSISVAAAGAGAWALVLQQVALATAFVVSLWWRRDWRPTFEFSLDDFRGSAASRSASPVGDGHGLPSSSCSLLIGKLVGVTELGLWAFATSAVILPLSVISIPIAEVLFPAFSRMQGEHERIGALWLDSIRLLAAVILPGLVGLAIVAPDAIPLVFGSQWSAAVPVIQILSVYVIIRTLQSWNSPVLDAAVVQSRLDAGGGAARVTRRRAHRLPLGSRSGRRLLRVQPGDRSRDPLLAFVLAELRMPARRVAAGLWAIVATTGVMAAACLAARYGLLETGIGFGGRTVATIAVGVAVYAAVLSLLAPDISRRVLGLLRRLGRGGVEPLPPDPSDGPGSRPSWPSAQTGLRSVDSPTLARKLSTMTPLRSGDVVEVRPAAEILATLDADGALEAVPFMPEMRQYMAGGSRSRAGSRRSATRSPRRGADGWRTSSTSTTSAVTGPATAGARPAAGSTGRRRGSGASTTRGSPSPPSTAMRTWSGSPSGGTDGAGVRRPAGGGVALPGDRCARRDGAAEDVGPAAVPA